MTKTAVIGLDCADPNLVFGELWNELPNLRSLAEVGTFGPLRSVVPPITVPAWMCMVTGKDPGELGIYGFRNRPDHSYGNVSFATSGMLRSEPVWQTFARAGNKRCIILNVPMTYPARSIQNGCMVSGFLAPSLKSQCTWPPGLKDELQQICPCYLFDTEGFRGPNKQKVLESVYSLTKEQFRFARHTANTRPWDFFMFVSIGPDRMHHTFWAHHDPTHPKHNPKSPFKNAIRNYYRYIDTEIGELLSLFPQNTRIVVVSDHGIQKMHGGFALNDWLIREGYLVLKKQPGDPTPLGNLISDDMVDWSKTIAWAWGGYTGKVFLNIKAREPQGFVPQGRMEQVLEKLKAKMQQIPGEDGESIKNECFEPQAIYNNTNNIAPDLLVHLGGLSRRVLGTVGNASLYMHENDTGPDDANHAMDGIFISNQPGPRPRSLLQIHDYLTNSL